MVRVGFGMEFFRDRDSRIFYFELDHKIPEIPRSPGFGIFFQSRNFYSRDSRFFASRDFNPGDSGFFLISGFLSSGFLLNSLDLRKIPGIRDFFGIFYLRHQDFFPWDGISPQKANSAYSF